MPFPTIERLATPQIFSNTDAPSYATISVAPVNGALYYFVVGAFLSGAQTVTPTLAGTNGWPASPTQRGTVLANNDIRLTVFSGVAVSDTAGTLTADFGAETQQACTLSVYRVRNANEAPVQSKSGTTTAGTSLALTLDSALTSVWNLVVMFLVNDATSGGITDQFNDQRYYSVGTQNAATDGVRQNALWSPGAVTSITASGMQSSDIAGLLFEIPHDGSDAGGGLAQLVGPSPLVQTNVL